jgi:uncharacterized protein (TIGR02284 family)
MVTTVGTEDRLEDLLVDLVQLDFDAAEAYQSAIDRLKDPNYRNTLMSFKEDHLRHTRELGQILTSMGITPPKQGDLKQILAKGKVVIGGLLGDRAILEAMRTNEDDTVTAYDRAVRHSAAPAETRECLERNRTDEHRHCDWIRMTLDATR